MYVWDRIISIRMDIQIVISQAHRRRGRRAYLQAQLDQLHTHANNNTHTADTHTQQLVQQNRSLHNQLTTLTHLHHQHATACQSRIQQVRDKYIHKIKQISQQARTYKAHYQNNIKEMLLKIQQAQNSIQNIVDRNMQMQMSVQNGQNILEQYQKQVQQQYNNKLVQFQQMVERGQNNIHNLQNKLKSQDIVQQTLCNEQLIKQIKESVQRASPDIDRIHAQYLQLKQSKQQIIIQLKQNIQIKQKQIKHCKQLHGKLNIVLDRMKQEKQMQMEINQLAKQQIVGQYRQIQQINQ